MNLWKPTTTLRGLVAKIIRAILTGRNEDFIPGLFALLFLIALSGSEAMKVLIRRKIGLNVLKRQTSIAASILWAIYTIILYYHWQALENVEASSHPLILVGIIFNGILAIGIFISSMPAERDAEKREVNENDGHNYRGESIFFNHLLKKGYKKETIWVVVEPLSSIAVGGLLTLIQPYIGLPLLVASVSFLFNEWYKVKQEPVVLKNKEFKMRAIIGGNHPSNFNDDSRFGKVE